MGSGLEHISRGIIHPTGFFTSKFFKRASTSSSQHKRSSGQSSGLQVEMSSSQRGSTVGLKRNVHLGLCQCHWRCYQSR